MGKEVKLNIKSEGFEEFKAEVNAIRASLQDIKDILATSLGNPPIKDWAKLNAGLSGVNATVKELSQYTEKGIKLISTSLEKQIDQTQKSIKEYTEGGEKVKKALKDQKELEDVLIKTYKEKEKKNLEAYSSHMTKLQEYKEELGQLEEKNKDLSDQDAIHHAERIARIEELNEKIKTEENTLDLIRSGREENEEAHANNLKERRKKLAEDIFAIDVEVQEKNKAFYEKKAQLIREAGDFEKTETISKYNELLASEKLSEKEREDLIKRKNDHLAAIDSETQRRIAENTKELATKNIEVITSSVAAILKQSEKAVIHGKKAAEELVEAVSKSVDAVAKKVEETKWDDKFKMKSVINVEATKQDVERVGIILKEYEIKLKDLHNNKLISDKQYEAASKKISAAIVENDKRDNALRLQQVQAYAANAQAILEKGMAIGKDAIVSTEKMFTDLAGIHKKNVESIDEELKGLDEKNKDYVEERNMREKSIATLTQERIKAEIAGDQETMASLDLKISKEKEAFDKSKEANGDYEKERAKLEAKKAKEKERQEKKERIAAKIKLGREMAEAVINVAKGVTVALAKGPILGPILAAIVTAQGAIQLATMTKQMTQLEDGGLLRGKRHSQGGMRIEGTNIEVEGGEYVVNRESTKKNLGLIRYINSQRKELRADDLNTYFTQSVPVVEAPFHNMFASGGQLPVSDVPTNVENELLLDAIKSIKFSPKVAVTDIVRVQEEMTSVDGWAGL